MASNTDNLILKPRTSQELFASFAKAFAERCFVLPENNASTKEGPALKTGPEISKAPNRKVKEPSP